jgi:deoxyribonuclease-4
MVKFGFHVSISGQIDKAVDRAVELGCETFQIFTRNPRSWSYNPLKDSEIEAFKDKRVKAGIEPVFSHMPYILNLASPNKEIYRRSIDSLAVELARCSLLDIPYVVTHLGSHLGSGAPQGVVHIIDAITTVLDQADGDTMILLENGSGSGNRVGSSFQELQSIIEGVDDHEHVGVCFDTCHAFSSGYELRTLQGLAETIEAFSNSVDFRRLKLMHLNDSVGGLGSGIDHHEHIGLGEIGEEGFKLILNSRLANAPMIMETPIDERRSDNDNMRLVKHLFSKRNS